MKDVGVRVRELIDRVHGGSVNAAAKALGIPQSSLAKIVSGAVKNPRVQTLQIIVNHFGGTLDWLATGEGQAPPLLQESPWNVVPQAEYLRWRSLVDQLAA